MSYITDVANITIDRASSSEASSSKASTQSHLSQINLTVFSILHFFMSLSNYIELCEYCVTCRLLFKFKKHLDYNLTDHYSILYYENDIFRTRVLERIANPQKQLYLIMYNVSVTDLSVLGNVHYLNL
jgi:hypothetical protein